MKRERGKREETPLMSYIAFSPFLFPLSLSLFCFEVSPNVWWSVFDGDAYWFDDAAQFAVGKKERKKRKREREESVSWTFGLSLSFSLFPLLKRTYA
jgi:hypothetical protein